MIDNENNLILKAMLMASPVPANKKRKVQKRIEPSIYGAETVPGLKPHKPRKPPRHYVSNWKPIDFLRHLNKNLSVYGMELETVGMRDSEWMNKLHDDLLRVFQEQMCNRILRDYLDWWCGTYAQYKTDKDIYVNMLSNEKDIHRFFREKTGGQSADTPNVSSAQKEDVVDQSETLSSELQTLLIEQGIVVAYLTLKKRNQTAIFTQLSAALKELSKRLLEQSMRVTLRGSYEGQDKIDFISLARPALDYYGLSKKFQSIDYQDYF